MSEDQKRARLDYISQRLVHSVQGTGSLQKVMHALCDQYKGLVQTERLDVPDYQPVNLRE